MSENFVIEDVWFYPDGSVGITARNVGKVDMIFISIEFNGTNRLALSQIFPAKQAETITIDWN